MSIVRADPDVDCHEMSLPDGLQILYDYNRRDDLRVKVAISKCQWGER